MNKPKKPVIPRKPIEPLKNVVKNHPFYDDTIYIKDILDILKDENIDMNKCGPSIYYDTDEGFNSHTRVNIYLHWEQNIEDSQPYKDKLKKYNEQLNEYNLKILSYDEELKTYNQQYKEYLKEINSKKIKTLIQGLDKEEVEKLLNNK